MDQTTMHNGRLHVNHALNSPTEQIGEFHLSLQTQQAAVFSKKLSDKLTVRCLHSRQAKFTTSW